MDLEIGRNLSELESMALEQSHTTPYRGQKVGGW